MQERKRMIHIWRMKLNYDVLNTQKETVNSFQALEYHFSHSFIEPMHIGTLEN